MKKYLLLILLSFIANLALAQDVWLQNHFSPNSGIQLSGLENVTVLVNNNSGVIMASNTIQVNYTINGGATISQMLSSNLTAGASWNFTFSAKADLSVYGTYVIKVWVVRAGDVNHLNDTLEWTVQNDCIVMNQPQNMSVDHNATVPAVNYTSSANGVSYFWTNTNPAIGLSSSGIGNLPSFTAINKRGIPVTSTITVTPKYNITNTFSYTGNMQTFVVPAGVTRIKVDVKGSKGGSAIYNQPGTKPDDIGGKGGRVTAEYPVTAGQTLYIFVGGIGYNGGGNGGGSIAQPNGGGASDIRMGGMALANRIIVAGGGGGGGNNCSANAEPGGAGGGLIGEVGFQCGNQTGTAVGQGGTQLEGGAAGTSPATAGILGIGGNAGGLGTASGGGGGGYYGGGGAAYGGGGGGSSYTDPLATSVQHTQGFQDGLGEVIISYYQECGPSNSKTFNITVNPTSQPNANGILFVKKGSVGTGNAWNNAIGELADALLVAKDLNVITAGSVTQIWVAGGTYKPMYSPADNNFGNQAGRDNAFLMVKDVKVYGGFDPDNGKINLATRDPQSVLTILSGDIDGNDVQSGAGATLSFSNNNENARHVLVSAGNVGTAELNGFTITGGNGNGTTITVNGLQLWGTHGGGMNITSSSPTLSYCIFEYNQVQTGMGGALYIGTPTNEAVSAPLVSKSSFVNNKSDNIAGVGWGEEGGSALYNSASSPIVTECVFTGNLVTGSRLGGAIANNGLTMEVSNTAIKNNISLGANGGGSGLANSGAGQTILKNVILSGNYTDGKGGAIYNNPGAISSLQNVLISGNQADAGAGIYNNGSSPVLTNVTIAGNQANLGGGIYNINSSLPLLQNTVVFGNSTGVINNLPADLPTYKNSLIQGESAVGLIPFNGAATDLFVQPLTPALAVGGDYKPKSGSILVNAGDNTLFTNLDANTKDLAGNIRLKGANIDLGAYELQSQPQVISPITTITKTYGDVPFGPGGISSSGLVVGYASADNSIAEAYQDTADGNKWKLKIKKAGTVQVTASQAGGANNGDFYDPAPNVVFDLVVNKKQITVTLAGTFSKIYDGNTNATLGAANLIVDPNAIVGTDQLAVSSGITGTFDDKNVGTGKTVSVAIANVSLSGSAAANYSLANAATLTAAIGEITVRAITVTAQTDTKVYDGTITSSAIPLITSGTIAAGDQLSTAAIQKFDNKNAGTSKVLTATGLMVTDGNGGGNYQITYVAVSTGVITPKQIMVTAMGKTKIYGESDPALTYGFTPALVGSDSFTGSLSRAQGEDVGHYPINIGSLSLNGNYTINYTGADLTITLRTLTITADAKQKTYGDADPVLTYTSNGLMGLDAITGSLSRVAGEDIGTYAIGRGSLTAGINYAVVYVPANLVIASRVVTITADAKQKTYGDTDPALTYGATGLLVGDVVKGSLARQMGEDVGTYPINKGTLSVGGNYTLNYVGANLAINKKMITVTAVAKGKVYGDADPILAYTSSSALLAGDSFMGSLSRTVGEDAGTYHIGQGTLTAGGNYTVSYQPASFTIEKAVLLATANNSQMCQGASLPSFTLSYSGFRRGDGENSISTRPTVGTTANSGSPAGSYALVPSGGSAANYSFSYANGILTINALPQISISSNRGNNISRGETLQLTASGGTSYSWSGPGGIMSGQNSEMLTIRPIASGTYIVRATNASGCSSEQSFTVTVRDDFQAISATNLLTPNGDGINDVWKVDNIDVYPNNEVVVFDRAGRVLYRKKGYDNSWNGTVNGAALAEGTYYYVIDFGSGKLKQKGFITLIREGR